MTITQQQPDLFDCEATDSTVLVAIAGPKPELSKAQREFNTLTDRIRRLREELAQWRACQQRVAERWAQEMGPAMDALYQAQVSVVRRIDTWLCRPPTGVKLTRQQKQTLSQHLLLLVDDLLASGKSDAELEALHDRYSDISRAEQQAIEREFTEVMLEGLFGADVVASFEGNDSESLLRHAQAKLDEADAAEAAQQQQRAAERAAKRGKPGAAELAAERMASAAKQASQSLRDIFRKLASALHPDRETDDTERERKTLLMKRVNQAYQNDDLLELLSLQIEVEQIDGEHLSTLPEQRLHHYNHLLKEQTRTLKEELDTLALPLLHEFDLYPMPNAHSRTLLGQRLTQRVATARLLKDKHCDALAALDDPQRRRQLLDQLAAEQREDAQDAESMAFDIFPGTFASAPPRQRKRKHKPRR